MWFFADAAEHADLDSVWDTLNEAGSIIVDKLHVRPGPGETRRIIDREATIVGRNAVATITPAHLELVEAEA